MLRTCTTDAFCNVVVVDRATVVFRLAYRFRCRKRVAPILVLLTSIYLLSKSLGLNETRNKRYSTEKMEAGHVRALFP